MSVRPYQLLLVTILSACTAGESMSSLREGMSRAEVEAVLGRPDGFQRSDDQVGYQYANRLMSGWGWDRADYYALFDGGRLVQWGPGEIRTGSGPNVGTLVVVPLR
jgi:hypothetical protein